jgi:hypothetical protein
MGNQLRKTLFSSALQSLGDRGEAASFAILQDKTA